MERKRERSRKFSRVARLPGPSVRGLHSQFPRLPHLSDLESAFLHFTFLPVRREIAGNSAGRVGGDRAGKEGDLHR